MCSIEDNSEQKVKTVANSLKYRLFVITRIEITQSNSVNSNVHSNKHPIYATTLYLHISYFNSRIAQPFLPKMCRERIETLLYEFQLLNASTPRRPVEKKPS